MSRLSLKNVAVIGAGPAGLCTARHLLHSNINTGVPIKPIVFEQNDVVGGTWVYQDIDNVKEVFSSLYTNMKTNLPKQVMLFPEFPFPDDAPTYMRHTYVRKYLEDYAKRYQLKDYIQFNTEVIKVSPILDMDEDISDSLGNRFVRWNVVSRNKLTEELVEGQYDAVVVCNGHYSTPVYPSIMGLHNFNGKLLHSHYYRQPLEFSGKDVLILGCGPSALDIMVELSNYCRMVYISHRGKRVTSVLPHNVVEVPNITCVNENGQFVFEDSSSAQVDTFLPCTGYSLNFPFLTTESGIITEDNTIFNLYKHIFNIKYPSLIFVGLTWQNAPLPAMHQQCQYIMKVISETKKLPCAKEMSKDTENEQVERLNSGELRKYFHRMGDRQWAYNQEIAAIADNKENPAIIENLYKHAMKFRSADLACYKNKVFRALNDSEFETLPEE